MAIETVTRAYQQGKAVQEGHLCCPKSNSSPKVNQRNGKQQHAARLLPPRRPLIVAPRLGAGHHESLQVILSDSDPPPSSSMPSTPSWGKNGNIIPPSSSHMIRQITHSHQDEAYPSPRRP